MRTLRTAIGLILILTFADALRAAAVTGRAIITPAAKGKAADNSGIVVWLEPAGSATPDSGASTPAPLKMVQKNQTFQPHILAVQSGTAVDFPNGDPIFHNVFSNYGGQVFDLQLYAPQTSKRVVFRRPGIAYIFCNIHESMSGIVAVVPTSYFALTGRDGRFEINAPAGNYRLHVWHERSVARKLQELERDVTVSNQGLNIGEIRVSEDGYVAQSHNNKYGQKYPPAPESSFFYPGGRR